MTQTCTTSEILRVNLERDGTRYCVHCSGGRIYRWLTVAELDDKFAGWRGYVHN